MKQTQNLYEKIEFIVYILCIFLTCATYILIYADGVMRDEYNVFLDGLRLRQSLFLLIPFTIVFVVSKRFCTNGLVKKLIMVIFIPIFLITSITLWNNVSAARAIIRENRFCQTDFSPIQLNDLRDIFTNEKTLLHIGGGRLTNVIISRPCKDRPLRL